MRSDFLWLEVPSVPEDHFQSALASDLFNGAPSWLADQDSYRTCSPSLDNVDRRPDLLPRAALRRRFVGRVRFYDFC